MNRQEIFNKVVKHLLTQNERAVDKDGFCSYKTHNGLKCAIGALIPDGHPAQHASCSVSMSFFAEYDLKEYLCIKDESDVSFLWALQRIHDGREPYEWDEALRDFAVRNELIMPA